MFYRQLIFCYDDQAERINGIGFYGRNNDAGGGAAKAGC